MSSVYQFAYLPDFKGEITRSTIGPKNRTSLQSDVLEVIAGRNRFYLLHAARSGVPFQYDNRNSIYLDDKVVASLNQVQGPEEGKEKDLVRLVEPDVIIDIKGINSELHAVTKDIGGKKLLIAYPFFDFLLYLREKIGNPTDEEMLRWAITNNYFKIEMDDAGRIVVTEFKEPLGITNTLAYRGFKGSLIIGNPEYLEGGDFYQKPRQGHSHHRFKGRSIQRKGNDQPELFGPPVLRLVARLHPRGSEIHQRDARC